MIQRLPVTHNLVTLTEAIASGAAIRFSYTSPSSGTRLRTVKPRELFMGDRGLMFSAQDQEAQGAWKRFTLEKINGKITRLG